MPYLLLYPVLSLSIADLLSRKQNLEISLCCGFLNALCSLGWIHILNHFDGILSQLIVEVFFLRRKTGKQLIGVFKGTFLFELLVEVTQVSLKLLLALYHGLLMQLIDISEGIYPCIKFVKIIFYHGHLRHLLLNGCKASSATLNPIFQHSCSLAFGI